MTKEVSRDDLIFFKDGFTPFLSTIESSRGARRLVGYQLQQGLDQQLLEAKDRMDAIEGIKRGLQSMKTNAGKPAAEFFREFFAEKGISNEE